MGFMLTKWNALQHLEYRITKSLDNKLPEDETWEADLYMNDYRYRSIPRYG